jgi:hypothetical protein
MDKSLREGMMRTDVTFNQRYRAAVQDEIAIRVKQHQAAVAALGAAPTAPLVMLAMGDSWFDYPLDGDAIAASSTDIIAQLPGASAVKPLTLNISHYGDTSAQTFGWEKQARVVGLLADPANWSTSGKPDAILISAGGNEIIGDCFSIYLGYETLGEPALDERRFQGALASIRASYQSLISFRDLRMPGVPIFAHCYDYPYPSGVGVRCRGPWLKPGLDYAGWGYGPGVDLCHRMVTDFRAVLTTLASDAANLFILVDTQGTLGANDWANELHPFPAGFGRLAGRFVATLRGVFPGRI